MRAGPTLELRQDVVYLAPSGRRCRWLPRPDEGRRVTTYAVFVYLDQPERPRHLEAAAWLEGFHLTPPNFGLLRVEGVR